MTNSILPTAKCQDIDAARIDKHHVNIDSLTSRGWVLGVYHISQFVIAGANHRGASGFVLQKLFDDRLEEATLVTDTYAVEIWTDPEFGDIGTCTCPDHVHRRKICKHIAGLHQLNNRGDLLTEEGEL